MIADLEQLPQLDPASLSATAQVTSRLDVFHGYIGVLVASFIVTLLVTPLIRKLAVSHGVIDHPNEARKQHTQPIAYLGGIAVFLGIISGVLYSYLARAFPHLISWHTVKPANLVDGDHAYVPISIIFGLTVITLVGVLDDIKGMMPRVKIGGQLMAAAALAYDDVGVRVAAGVLGPIGELFGNPGLTFTMHLPFTLPLNWGSSITIDMIYWTGTAIIALFVLGACNASNLIDGLDGLLTGTTAICGIGLLVVAVGMAATDTGPRDAQRIVLCMALVGACLGFLPHNFNPANIFLGDAGSLQLGFLTIVIVLTLGNEGQTQLVLAGLIMFAIPIIDTTLAIVRRKLAGKSMSEADSDHLHHMLKRSLGVKGAVLSLYGIGGLFALLGVLLSVSRARLVYLLALMVASYIIVTAIKLARRKQIEAEVPMPAASARSSVATEEAKHVAS